MFLNKKLHIKNVHLNIFPVHDAVFEQRKKLSCSLIAVTGNDLQSVTKAIGPELMYEVKLLNSAWPV